MHHCDLPECVRLMSCERIKQSLFCTTNISAFSMCILVKFNLSYTFLTVYFIRLLVVLKTVYFVTDIKQYGTNLERFIVVQSFSVLLYNYY